MGQTILAEKLSRQVMIVVVGDEHLFSARPRSRWDTKKAKLKMVAKTQHTYPKRCWYFISHEHSLSLSFSSSLMGHQVGHILACQPIKLGYRTGLVCQAKPVPQIHSRLFLLLPLPTPKLPQPWQQKQLQTNSFSAHLAHRPEYHFFKYLYHTLFTECQHC